MQILVNVGRFSAYWFGKGFCQVLIWLESIEPSGLVSSVVNWIQRLRESMCSRNWFCVLFSGWQRYHPHTFSTFLEPNPPTGKFIEGARSCHTIHQKTHWTIQMHLAKYKVRIIFFKSTRTFKSLLMHPKDSISDAQETDIIYHWKWPAHNCTAENIGETNRSLKERVSDLRNKTTSAIRNHHISTIYPKVELKDFTMIDSDSNILHHSAKKALHTWSMLIFSRTEHWFCWKTRSIIGEASKC